MKKIVLLLVVVCAALLAALVLRAMRADALLESAQKETLTVSNQLSEAHMKVNHQERRNAALQSQLAERETSLAGWSNTVAQLRTALNANRTELDAARAEIPPAMARGQAFAAERDVFSNRVNEMEAAWREQTLQLQAARASAVAIQTEHAALSHAFAKEQADRVRLENLLKDRAALEVRLADARRLSSPTEKPKPGGKPDYHQALQLQPDGTVLLKPAE